MKNLYEVCMIHSMKAPGLSISKIAYVSISICRAFTAIGRKHFGVRNDWTRSVLHRGKASFAAIKSIDHFALPKPIMTLARPELEHKVAELHFMLSVCYNKSWLIYREF